MSAKPPFVPGPVACARNVPLYASSSGQPVMGEAILDYFMPMRLGLVTSTPQGSADPAQDGVAKEIIRWVETSGCLQPGKGEKLDILAGGERSWQSAILHTLSDFNVPTDTVIIMADETRNRIMRKSDFSANGYVRYELLQDYAGPS